jgi:hypothetical protein
MFTTISTYYTFPKTIKIHVKYISNKKFMQTIFEVSIQPAAGYLVNCHCHLSIHTHQIFKTLL